MRERHSMDGRLDLIGRYARKEAQMEIKMLLVMFIKCLFDVCHSSCDDNCWHMLATHYLSPIIISIFFKVFLSVEPKRADFMFWSSIGTPISLQRRRLQMLFMWCATSMHDRNVRILRILRILYRMPHVNVPFTMDQNGSYGEKVGRGSTNRHGTSWG